MPMNDKNLTRGCVLLRAWLAESPSRTQASLAEDLEISAAAVSNIITGRNGPSREVAALLQARTRDAVRAVDWLDATTGARVERMARLMEA